MKSLRKQISKARDLAIQAKVDGSPHVQLADKCRATVKKIAGVIRNLGEDTDNEKTGEVGQDLYVFVLPEMFGLLDMIITYLDQDDHVSSPAIAEILEFIRLIQTLCETAEGWKREVINSIPVYRAIKSAAMQLGAMEEVLSRELARIIKGVRDRKQQKWLEERREKFEEEQARRTAEHQQRVFERRLRINEQLQKTTHPRFATYIRVDDDLWTPPRSSTGILLPLSDHQRPGAGQVPTVGVAGEQEDNEMVERVHMFDRRTDPPVDRSLWTLLETEALIEGLERFTGPDRYLQILEEYSNRGDALCERDIDQLHAKAKEIRSDLLTDMAMHPESSEQPAPDWLLSIR
ncbi:MAG: hypothetical protein M1838_001237 [Thelocarpon superellum]|nr:MAG: hypothetical protein M1838_001237 [Thelocarpon superellum]